MIQPLSSTSRVMKIGISQADKSDAAPVDMALIAYWTLRPRLMRVPGVANVAIWGDRWHQAGPVDPDLMAAQRHDDPGAWRPPRTPRRGQLKFPGRPRDRHRRLHRHPQPALQVQHQLPALTVDRNWPACPSTLHRRAADPPVSDVADDVRRRHAAVLLIGDAVINDGPGLMLIVEKLPWAQHAGRHPRASRRRSSELQPGAAGHRGRHRRSSGRPPSSRPRSTTWPGDAHRLRAGRLDPGSLPLRVARGADQRRRPSRCRWWRPGWCSTPGQHDQHDDPGRLGDRPRGGGRRRHHRHREHRPAAPRSTERRAAPSRPRRSSSTPRSRCAAPIVTPR